MNFLSHLQNNKGAKHRTKRLGCGESSGHGKTSGRGHKGQRARSGGSVRLGFEGGQMPLFRRLPKKGFNNRRFKKKYAVVNLDSLENHFDANTLINESVLRAKGLISGSFDGIKLLARGEISKALKIEVTKSSHLAVQKVENAGGTVSLVN